MSPLCFVKCGAWKLLAATATVMGEQEDAFEAAAEASDRPTAAAVGD